MINKQNGEFTPLQVRNTRHASGGQRLMRANKKRNEEGDATKWSTKKTKRTGKHDEEKSARDCAEMKWAKSRVTTQIQAQIYVNACAQRGFRPVSFACACSGSLVDRPLAMKTKEVNAHRHRNLNGGHITLHRSQQCLQWIGTGEKA